MVSTLKQNAIDDEIQFYKGVVYEAASGNVKPLVENILKIQSKDGDLVPLRFNPAQDYYWNQRTQADIILKAAQMGFSTLVIAEFFAECMVIPGIECIIVAQRDESVRELFQIINTFMASMPPYFRPQLTKDTESTIIFDHSAVAPGLSSRITTGTIRSDTVGRGRPRHRALFTEVAFYPKEAQKIMSGIIARLPRGRSRLVLESTADGQAGYFYELWQAATTGGQFEDTPRVTYTGHFIPWYMAPEYVYPMIVGDEWGQPLTEYTDHEQYLKLKYDLSDDQLRWRRWQIATLGDDMFKQEFPETADEAFLPVGSSVFEPSLIDRNSYQVKAPVTKLNDFDVWKTPEFQRTYIISVDQASGEQRDPNNRPLDFSAITVWDSVTLEQMATFRSREVTAKELAKVVSEIAEIYNHGLIAPEANLAKYGFIDWILEYGVKHIYMHRTPNTQRIAPGYPMTVATKPALKDNFKNILDTEGGCTLHSENLIRELRNFRFLKGAGMRSMGAAPGGNDDELITAFIAFDPEVRAQAYSTLSSQLGTNRKRSVRTAKVF